MGEMATVIKELFAENEQLKEENQKLKEEVERLRVELVKAKSKGRARERREVGEY